MNWQALDPAEVWSLVAAIESGDAGDFAVELAEWASERPTEAQTAIARVFAALRGAQLDYHLARAWCADVRRLYRAEVAEHARREALQRAVDKKGAVAHARAMAARMAEARARKRTHTGPVCTEGGEADAGEAQPPYNFSSLNTSEGAQ